MSVQVHERVRKFHHRAESALFFIQTSFCIGAILFLLATLCCSTAEGVNGKIRESSQTVESNTPTTELPEELHIPKVALQGLYSV